MESTVLSLETFQPVSPDEQRCAAVRMAYPAYITRRKGFTVSFDEMYGMFSDPELSWHAIAQRYGVPNKFVENLYYRLFAPLFGGKSGRELWRARVLRARSEQRRELPRDARLRSVALAAERAGLTVHQVPLNSPNRSERCLEALSIQGLRCQVRRLVHRKRFYPETRRRAYVTSRFIWPLDASWDAYIIHVVVPGWPERMFIIPAYVIRRLPHRAGCGWLAITLDSKPSSAHRRMDWTTYENAWHFLESGDE